MCQVQCVNPPTKPQRHQSERLHRRQGEHARGADNMSKVWWQITDLIRITNSNQLSRTFWTGSLNRIDKLPIKSQVLHILVHCMD